VRRKKLEKTTSRIKNSETMTDSLEIVVRTKNLSLAWRKKEKTMINSKTTIRSQKRTRIQQRMKKSLSKFSTKSVIMMTTSLAKKTETEGSEMPKAARFSTCPRSKPEEAEEDEDDF
jgi:hypothetical protein